MSSFVHTPTHPVLMVGRIVAPPAPPPPVLYKLKLSGVEKVIQSVVRKHCSHQRKSRVRGTAKVNQEAQM